MLGVKLHSQKRVKLGPGSYLIPILRWDSGKIFVRRWVKRLNRNTNPSVTRVRFVTLVSIPDNHPIAMYVTAVGKNLAEHRFRPLNEIPDDEQTQITLWYDRLAATAEDSVLANQPEVVLGSTLPRKHIKWTKQVQRLYEWGPTRAKQRGQ